MKSLLVLCCCIIASNALDKEFIEKFLEKMRTVGDECITETHASKEDIANLLIQKLPESHEGKCLIFCMHRKFNAQKEDGTLDIEGAIASWEPLKQVDGVIYEKIVNTMKNCEHTADTDPDPCIYASNLAECAIKEGKSVGLDQILVLE